MKAAQLIIGPEGPILKLADIPMPVAGVGEVLVEIHAAGVTPSELSWYPTTHDKSGGVREHAVPAHEFSGVVAHVGEGVVDLAVDDQVYGMSDWFADGATAEFCVTVPHSLAPKPANSSHAEAAAVPIGALTAMQGLFDRAKLQAGERVLIHGGAGAVGVFAVQLAKLHGAEVIATASRRHAEFLQGLGVAQVIDYREQAFDEVLSDIDVVFDCVGGDTLRRSWSVLRDGGRLITIAADSEGTQDDRTKAAFFIVEPNRQQLVEVAQLLDAGKLQVFVDAEVSLADASIAYAGKAERRYGYGKVVVLPRL
jgi:NADPH:quinone reductase-like Zn-dependent oxidoreductase